MNEQNDNTIVLIVGAGPTGLTLACELARRGVSFRLIEAVPGPQAGSRGKGLQPRTLEVFDDLGIADGVLAHGRTAMPVRVTTPNGQVIQEEGVTQERRPDLPYPASLIIPEWRVEEALRQRLAELGGAVEFGTTLDSFVQDEEGVSATLVRGGQGETVGVRWLVGCDGGHSTVRKQAGIAFEGETRREIRMMVADVEVEGLDREAWHMWQHQDGLATLCPLPSTDIFQYQASIAPGQDPELSLANMQAILARRSGRTDIVLRELAWSSMWHSNVRLVDRYREGRVFLAGDAAHIHSPAGGQGMNTGIQDAYNLGWKLAAVAQGAAPALLDSYESERRPVAASVLAISNAGLQQAIQEKRVAVRGDASLMQLSINYRGSPLARDDREDCEVSEVSEDRGEDRGEDGDGDERDEIVILRAGDRAPDASRLATADGERRLFDLTRGAHFTLLNFGPAAHISAPGCPLRIFHIVEQVGGPDDIGDMDGYLAGTYRRSDRTLVLIRPDGYIALISDAGDVAAVTDYLAVLGLTG